LPIEHDPGFPLPWRRGQQTTDDRQSRIRGVQSIDQQRAVHLERIGQDEPAIDQCRFDPRPLRQIAVLRIFQHPLGETNRAQHRARELERHQGNCRVFLQLDPASDDAAARAADHDHGTGMVPDRFRDPGQIVGELRRRENDHRIRNDLANPVERDIQRILPAPAYADC